MFFRLRISTFVVCSQGQVSASLNVLKASSATGQAKARFILATDGETVEAEDLENGEAVACTYGEFPDHFGFFFCCSIDAGRYLQSCLCNGPLLINQRSNISNRFLRNAKFLDDGVLMMKDLRF